MKLSYIRNKYLIHRAVSYSIGSNFVALFFGPLTVYFIAQYFSKEVQGYHYTFGSLIILQTLLELGMGQAIIQFISNEWGKLNIDNFTEINFTKTEFKPIIELISLTIVWYTVISLLILFIVLPAGFIFFSTSSNPSGVNWEWPWIFLSIFISTNTLLMPFFYLMQGCNQVRQYWFYRFLQQGVSGITAITVVISGAALYTYPIIALSILITGLLFLIIKYKSIMLDILSTFNFKFNRTKMKEVWALQWKIALSTITTTYTLQAFVPVLFKYKGVIAAGQMGMSLTLINIILAISSNWLIVNAPKFGILVAKVQTENLKHLFNKLLFIAISFSIAGSIIMLLVINMIGKYYNELATRILPLDMLALLSISIIVNTLLLSFSTYFRAYRQEPLIYVYAVCNILILITLPLIAQIFGTLGIVIVYLLILCLIQLPLSIIIFINFKKKYVGLV